MCGDSDDLSKVKIGGTKNNFNEEDLVEKIENYCCSKCGSVFLCGAVSQPNGSFKYYTRCLVCNPIIK